ncbi:hypothetical protein ACES2L_03155 [Bdellovibrio bacteriovorus]
MKNLLMISIMFLGVSCAHNEVEENKINQLDKVGVVAVFDESLPVDLMGSKKETAADIVSWNLNQNLESQLTDYFQSLNKQAFAVKVDPTVVETGKVAARSLKNLYLGNRYQGLEQYLVSEAEKQGAQYLVILHPSSSDNYPQYKAGYGLRCQNAGDELVGYGMMQAQLWNVKTKAVESRTLILPKDLTFKTGKPCSEAAKLPADSLAEQYKNQIVGLAKKSAELAIARTGEAATTTK